MESYLRKHLRRDNYSNYADDVKQDTRFRLSVIFKGARFVGINETNWRERGPRAILDRCMYTTLRFTMHEWIRQSAKYDHGTEGLELFATPDAAEFDLDAARQQASRLLSERSARDRDFWRLAGLEGRTTAEIAQLWDIPAAGVRLIRHRLLTWLNTRTRPDEIAD